MKANIIAQVKYMLSVAGKIYSWLIKNWLTIGTTSSMLMGALTVASPFINEKVERYSSEVLAPSFKKLNDRQDSAHYAIMVAQDSIYRELKTSMSNIQAGQIDTALIQNIVDKSYEVVVDKMPKEFEELFGGKMEALQVDTVWEINPYTGETLGYFMFSVDAYGRLILYPYSK